MFQILALAAAITLVIMVSWSYSELITSAQAGDTPDKPTGLSAEAGDTQVRLTWSDPGNASITKYQILQFAKKLISDDRSGGDELGWSVAVDSDTLVIGAVGDHDTENLSGSAYVFTRDAAGWTQAAKLTASAPKEDAGFGHAVAVHGDTIVVGAHEEDHGTKSDVGAAYVFTKPANGWASTSTAARLTASDAAANDEFGASVAVHEDTIVVGAPEENSNARGSAYIFTKPANDWADMTETAVLRGESNGDRLGRSVAVHGDTIVFASSDGNNEKGEAYVFTKSAVTGVWDDWDDKSASNATARLTASDRADRDYFGRAVAMDGETIVVGVPYDDDDGNSSGSAYVFTKPASGWTSTSTAAKLTASDAAENDEFGFSVAVDGNTVVVGARKSDSSRGSAYVFVEPQGGWTDTAGTDKRTAYDRSRNDEFGNSVAVDGDTVLVGAVGDDSDKGSAYVFGTGEWADIPGSGAGTVSHIARGLRNKAEHTFRVRAVNAAGEGGASDEESATPVAATSAPAAPANFSATQTGVGQVRLAWTASTEPLTVRRYQYNQDDGGGFGDWIIIEGSDSATVSYNVSGLTTGTTYAFTIRAVNSCCQSVPSYPRDVTIVAAPEAPTGLRAEPGDEQVKLSWSYTGSETSITGFQYQQSTVDELGDDWSDIIGSTAETRSHIVTGLTNGTEYTFRVRSLNGTVGSAPVGPQSATPTAEDRAPTTAPNLLSAVQTGVGEALLTWKAASRPLTVTGYRYTNDGGSSWSDISGSDSSTTSHTVTDLTTGSYKFAVRAVNSFGESDRSNYLAVRIVAKPNQPTGLNAEPGDKQATVRWNAPSDGGDQLLQVPQSKLTSDGGAVNDKFGYSVAIDVNTAVVGAPGANSGKGAAYVFTRDSNPGPWSQAATLTSSDTADVEFGISVAVDGNTIVVGALQDDTRNGAAYVFTKPNTLEGWVATSTAATLTALDGAAIDEFGISVAVDENTIVVGAHQHDHNGNSDAGAAYVFTKPGDAWVATSTAAKLTASDGAADDELGISVAIDGNTVVVGAKGHETKQGATYVFVKPGDHWTDTTETSKLTAFDGAANDEFGISVAVDVDTIVVGAHQHDLNSNPDAGAGAAYVFARNSGVWGQTAKLTASNGDSGDGFGISVAVDGVTVVIGAYLDNRVDDIVKMMGSVYVFISQSGVWSETLNLNAPDAASNDRFGYSVSVGGGNLLSGAPPSDDDPGSAYMMDISNAAWEDLRANESTVSDGVHFYRVRNLTNDQEYAFRVRSVNAAGNHPSAETKSATPRLAKPGKTEDLSAQAGDQQVTLRWDPSDDLTIEGYQESHYVIGKLTASVPTNEGLTSGGPWLWMIASAVVGAPEAADNGVKSGVAYVFIKDSGEWSQVAKLTASDGAANDEFGRSVAINGNTVVIGARRGRTTTQGAAYVFTKSGEGWGNGPVSEDPSRRVETAKLTASDGAASDQFGHSVAVAGGHRRRRGTPGRPHRR